MSPIHRNVSIVLPKLITTDALATHAWSSESTQPVRQKFSTVICSSQRCDKVIFPSTDRSLSLVGAMLRLRYEFELDRRGCQPVLGAICELVAHSNK